MSNVSQKYAFEDGTVPREPLSAREQRMLDALKAIRILLGSSIVEFLRDGSHQGLLDLIQTVIADVEHSS